MSRRPSRWLIVGEKVLADIEAKAPPDVKATFVNLLKGLQTGPYPGDTAINVFPAKGFLHPNLFIASHGEVHLLYQVTIDQPVIFLIAVLWGVDPNFPPNQGRGS